MSLGRPAFPVVISAPSGAGKTSLARALVERNDELQFSTSVTTRPKRPPERAGEDYHFVDDAEFDDLVAGGALVEWAEVHGHRYGTPRAEVDEACAAGLSPVLDIDVQGARQVRAAYPDALLIFILPPSAAELERRLVGRASEKAWERQRRLRNAQKELRAAATFDYAVINDDFQDALESLESILRTERSRIARLTELDTFVRSLDRSLSRILAEDIEKESKP